MITSLLSGVFSFILALFGFVITPIVNALGQAFGFDITTMADYITNFLTQCASCFGWVVNATGIDLSIYLVIAYLSARLIISFPVWIIKVVLRWYRILMP